jgi:hypothetical protein
MTRTMSVNLKRALFEKELMYIYQDFLRFKEERREQVDDTDDDE